MNKNSKIEEKLIGLGIQNYYSFAVIEATAQCNAACDYCFVKDSQAPNLSFGKICTMLDKIADAGILGLTITGGEPFLREDILDILSYAVKKDFWFLTVFTNGTVVTDEHIAFLKQHARYFTHIQLSLFSHVPEIHDAYVGIPGACEKTLCVAKKLKEAGVIVEFAVNMLDFNCTTFDETFQYLRSSGFPVRVGVTKIKLSNCLIKQNNERLRYTTSYDYYCTMLHDMGMHYVSSETKRFSQQSERFPIDQAFLCTGILTTIALDYKGNIRPCLTFRNLSIGNIFDPGTLREIVERSEELKKIKALRRADMTPCNTCKHSRTCNICLGLIHTETGEMNHPASQICSYAEAIETLL